MTQQQLDIAPGALGGEPLPPSLWAATAPAAPPTPALMESITTDVLVIGGGYTGLSTALHLAERGTQVTVLEANIRAGVPPGATAGRSIPRSSMTPMNL